MKAIKAATGRFKQEWIDLATDAQIKSLNDGLKVASEDAKRTLKDFAGPDWMKAWRAIQSMLAEVVKRIEDEEARQRIAPGEAKKPTKKDEKAAQSTRNRRHSYTPQEKKTFRQIDREAMVARGRGLNADALLRDYREELRAIRVRDDYDVERLRGVLYKKAAQLTER